MNQPYARVNQPYATLTLTSALRKMFGVQLYKNNARELLSRILSILNLDWLQHARSVRGVYEYFIMHLAKFSELIFPLIFHLKQCNPCLKCTVWNTNFKLASALLTSTNRKTEISPSLQVCTRILFDSWLKTGRYHIKLYSIVDEPTLLIILINFVSRQVRPSQKKKIVVLPSSGISEYLNMFFFLIIFFVKSTQSTKVGCFLQKDNLKKKTPKVQKLGAFSTFFLKKGEKKKKKTHTIWPKIGYITNPNFFWFFFWRWVSCWGKHNIFFFFDLIGK